MNQNYTSPFGTSAHQEPDEPQIVILEEYELLPEPKESFVGFKAPQPWDGWLECQRREFNDGFLYPAWHPFAVLEGNYAGSEFFDRSGYKVPPKVHGEVDQAMEARKKQFATPMKNKASYTAHSPVGTLKRSTD